MLLAPENLPARLLQLQDEERHRIARKLHDSAGQNLSALTMQLSMLLPASALDAGARDAIGESISLAERCVREIRELSYVLHPPLLDELGLVSALRTFIEGESKRTGLHFELDLPPNFRRLPHPIEISLFRIAQEAIANIHLHSGSSEAVVRLRDDGHAVEMEVTDFGRGMPRDQRYGIGIACMRERANSLDGRLSIEPNAPGTTLRVLLPSTSSAA